MLDCSEILNQSYPNDGRLYCNITKDEFGQCWNYTLAGTTAYGRCPETHEAADYFFPEGFSSKNCNDDGTWWSDQVTGQPWTNYINCVDQKFFEQEKRSRVVLYIYISGYALSSSLLTTALIIFTIFRQLKCTRVTIHKHLFVSYIINSLVMIGFFTQVTLQNGVIQESPIWCHVLFILAQYFMLTNYAWMTSEGFYLHSIIVAAFSNQRKLLIASCLIGWGLPLIFVGAYVMARLFEKDKHSHCWADETRMEWIFHAFVIIALLLNVIFLVNILRIILSKLKSDPQIDSTTKRYRKTLRACLILMPLLGIQFLLTPVTPEGDTFVYDVISAILTSYQGAAIAVLFCFLNGEVLKLIKRKITICKDQSSIQKGTMSPYMINVTVEEDIHSDPPRKSKNSNGSQYHLVPVSEPAIKLRNISESDTKNDLDMEEK